MDKKTYYDEKKTEIESAFLSISISDEELKQITKDLYDNKIFTTLHLEQAGNIHLITSVFIPMIFIGTIQWENPESRLTKLTKILLSDEIEEYNKRYDEFIHNIGMIYEYYDKSSPTNINGFPTFFSCHYLNISDTQKLLDYYGTYSKMRENIDSKF
jgi:hypothetical protein